MMFKKIETFYLKDKNFTFLVIMAIVLRLILMPICTGGDILANYMRASALLSGQFIKMYQAPIHYLHALFLLLLNPFLPNHGEIWLPISQANELLSSAQWDMIIRSNNVFRILFLLKLPYALFELGAAYLIYKIFKSAKRQRRAVLLWLYNPLIFYSLYMYARHEVLAIFFIVWAFYALSRKRDVLAFLLLGVGSSIRFSSVFLYPILFLYRPESRKKKIQGSILFVIPLLLSQLFSPGRNPEELQVLDPLYYAGKFLFVPDIEAGAFHLAPFFIFLTLVYLLYFDLKNKSFRDVINFCAFIYLGYFAIGYYHGPYIFWLAPFMSLIFAREAKYLIYFVFIFILYPFVLLTWDTAPYYRLTGLFAPLNPDFFLGVVTPTQLIDRLVPSEQVVTIARSALAGINFYLIYLLMKAKKPSLSRR